MFAQVLVNDVRMNRGHSPLDIFTSHGSDISSRPRPKFQVTIAGVSIPFLRYTSPVFPSPSSSLTSPPTTIRRAPSYLLLQHSPKKPSRSIKSCITTVPPRASFVPFFVSSFFLLLKKVSCSCTKNLCACSMFEICCLRFAMLYF